eukprot:augustus_masked-scaffold_5-processed-gene-8.16-mRNA-1 protein AED:0.06 eAED:0.10 QI:0/-1/0/1/-1/1/1/0/638
MDDVQTKKDDIIITTGKTQPRVKNLYSLCRYPDIDSNLLNFDLEGFPDFFPENVKELLNHLLLAKDSIKQQEINAWSLSDENKDVKESKFARGLFQEPGLKISSTSSDWECADSGMKENLWLNLSDGYIGSGRQNWDGTGGTGAALKHYEEMQKHGKNYPLCVKLGTIEWVEALKEVRADVFSYHPEENDMVKDPLLAEHLSHFGLDVRSMKKTDKTLAEMQVDLNSQYVFDSIVEKGKKLVPLEGEGYLGFTNLGNSCYMSSVLQVLLRVTKMLVDPSYAQDEVFLNYEGTDPYQNSQVQFARLVHEINKPQERSVRLRVLKDLFGRNHVDFGTTQQQDSAEYFSYILDKLEFLQGTFGLNLEKRLLDRSSGAVSYTDEYHTMLSLNIPRPKNMKTDETEGLPTVDFEACLKETLGDSSKDIITDYFSPLSNKNGIAEVTTLVKTMPDVLVVQLKRYYISELDYSPKKLEVEVTVPQTLDLENYRAKGLQEGEVELPKSDTPSGSDSLVQQLMGMGFEENLCRYAAQSVGGDPSKAAQATEWLFANMADPTYMIPPEGGWQKGKKPAVGGKPVSDGKGVYELKAIVSHLGKSTGGGHYVCHVYEKENSRWVLFNDDKVLISEQPPLKLGYMYFYQRQ